MHDLFDEVDVGLGAAQTQPVVMTAWHARLAEALDFVWECSVADGGKAVGPWRIVLLVGDACSAADVDRWMARRTGGWKRRIFGRRRPATSPPVHRPSPG